MKGEKKRKVMIKVLFLAPVRKGGPNLLLNKLSEYMFKKGDIQGDFYASIKGFLMGIFSRQYDVIHTVLPIPFNIWGTPIILNIHGNYKLEKSIKNPLGYLYPLSVRFATKVIVPSNFLKNKLNLKKAMIVPNFIDVDLLNSYTKKSCKIDKNKLKFCMMTKFYFKDKARGVVDVVKILNNVNISKKIEFNVLGTGLYLDEIKDEVEKLNVSKNINIQWRGFVDNPYEFMAKQDLFLYWSYLDNFPVSILEAMMLGLPVITNNVGAVDEFVKHETNGFICDADEYANVIVELIDNQKTRQDIGKNAKQDIVDNFSINSVSKNFISVYRKLYK